MRMGIPEFLTSDNGSEFKNELDAQLAMSLGIKRIFTTPYHTQVNLYFKFRFMYWYTICN